MLAYAKRFLLIAITFVAAVASVKLLRESPIFAIRKFSIELDTVKNQDPAFASKAFQSLTKKINEDLQNYVGQNLWHIELKILEKQIALYPWISTVSIRRLVPDTIQVQIHPKKWVALVMEKSMFRPVLETGDILENFSANDVPALPLLAKNSLSSQMQRQRIIQVLQALPQSGNLNLAEVTEAGLDGAGVYLTLLPNLTKIKFSDLNLNLQMARVEKVLEYLQTHEMQSRVIDADYEKKVLVKLRKPR